MGNPSYIIPLLRTEGHFLHRGTLHIIMQVEIMAGNKMHLD
jgi:hypothetical protein